MPTTATLTRPTVPTWDGYVRLSEHAPAPASADGFHRSWIMLMPMGQFQHPEYGALDFTRPELLAFKRKFDDNVRGNGGPEHFRIALDSDHKTGPAPGWIERIEVHDSSRAGDPSLVGKPAALYGLIKWTPLGVQLLKDDLYAYFSPEFATHHNEITGKKTPKVLMGGGLTNRPFLKSMPAVTLSERLSDETRRIALAEGVSTKPWGAIDKSTLPDSAFLDRKHRRLPVYEGAGPKDAKGRYTKRGPLNLNGVKAAYAALHGGRTGTPMTGLPAGVAATLERWRKQYHIGAENQDDGAQQHHEPVSASRSASPTVPASPARSSNRMATRQVALSSAALAEDEQQIPTAETVTLSSKGKKASTSKVSPEDKKVDAAIAALKKAQQEDEDSEEDEDGGEADASDEEELADPGMADEMEYAEEDAEDAADGGDDEAEEGDVDEAEDTHGPITTPKKGHKHGKYGYHTHADEADHSDAPLAEEEDSAGKLSEPRTAPRRTPATAEEDAGIQLGELAALLADDGDETSITLDDIRTLKRVARQLAEERAVALEEKYRADVTRLSERFSRTLRLPHTSTDATVAPSKVFRGRFESFMLSEYGRSLGDEGRNLVCQLLETAFLRGAVPVTQLSERAPDAATPLPPAEVGSRAEAPAPSTDGPRGQGQSKTITLAEGMAQQRYGKKLNELEWERKRDLLFEASKVAGYKGGAR